MKSNLIIIASILTLLGCTSEATRLDIAEFNIEFNKKYFFISSKYDLDIFNPRLANTITFHRDGSFTRTEDTTHYTVKDALYMHGIMITNLVGDWKIIENKVELFDNEIIDFHCTSGSKNQIVECDFKLNQITLGRLEKLNKATIKILDNNIIVYHQAYKK